MKFLCWIIGHKWRRDGWFEEGSQLYDNLVATHTFKEWGWICPRCNAKKPEYPGGESE